METIDRARAGDRAAVAELWGVYQPQLLRLLTAKRARSPEDVASQVWIDVGRSLDSFVGDGDDFRKWIFTVARWRSIDGHRRAARREVVSLLARPDELVEQGADEMFDDGAHSLERALAIVRQLAPSTAEAVVLRVVYEHSVSEVAAIMGRSEGAVRVLVHRGLRRLRVLLGDGAPVLAADQVPADEFPAGDLAGIENLTVDVTQDPLRALT